GRDGSWPAWPQSTSRAWSPGTPTSSSSTSQPGPNSDYPPNPTPDLPSPPGEGQGGGTWIPGRPAAMNDLDGKSALVTGGGKGIGAAVTRSLAQTGARVWINYRSDAASAEQTAHEVGGEAV